MSTYAISRNIHDLCWLLVDKSSMMLRILGEDFGIKNIASRMRFQDLANMSKNRGKSKTATLSLQLLVLRILDENLSKDSSVCCSKWAKKALTNYQKQYAALGAITSLQVYLALIKMTDLAARLSSSDVRRGLLADVVGQYRMTIDSIDNIC
jgi:hypothetical protein